MTPLEIVHLVAARLDKLGIPYMVGGSFASTLYGFYRTTQGADLIIDIAGGQVEKFIELFENEFYVSRTLIDQALRSGSSFNIIHLESSFKVDFFVIRGDRYSHLAFSRRGLKQIDPELPIQTYLQSAEDTVLAKLAWYREGGRVSELQWGDVIGMLRTQAERLDLSYLKQWATHLGVAELLDGAIKEAGIDD